MKLTYIKTKYSIKLGSLWAVMNSFWLGSKKEFASNKPITGYHPGLVIKDNLDGFSYQIAPGTTKKYQRGICVFDIKIRDRQSHFLLDLSSPATADEFDSFQYGWSGVISIERDKTESLPQQYRICLNS